MAACFSSYLPSARPDRGVSVMDCRRAVSKNNFGKIHGSDSHLNTVFVSARSLGKSEMRRKSSRRSQRWCMVWTLCVSKGQGSEEVLGAGDWPEPAVSPGWTLYCLDVAGSDQHSHSGALRLAENGKREQYVRPDTFNYLGLVWFPCQ